MLKNYTPYPKWSGQSSKTPQQVLKSPGKPRGTLHTNPVLPCYVHAGVGRMEVKIEPDCYDVTECFNDDKPHTGMFDILTLNSL